MNSPKASANRLTPWQCEVAGLANTLQKRFSDTASQGASTRLLWWGAGYSDLVSSWRDGVGNETVFVDSDPRCLRRCKTPAGEPARTIRLMTLADLQRDTATIASALGGVALRDIDSYLAFQEQLVQRFERHPAIASDWADFIVMDFILNRVGAEEEASTMAEAFRVLDREGCVLSATLVADEPVDAQRVKASPPGPALRLPTEKAALQAFERAGFHGVRLHWSADENPVAVDRIGGVDIRMCIIEAYKGRHGPCMELGQAVVYGGPWSEVHDDDGHVYRRGERVAVCAKTYALLMRAPYQGALMGLRSASEPPLEQAKPFDCNTPSLRDPKVTKGLAPFAGSRMQASACNADSGCC